MAETPDIDMLITTYKGLAAMNACTDAASTQLLTICPNQLSEIDKAILATRLSRSAIAARRVVSVITVLIQAINEGTPDVSESN